MEHNSLVHFIILITWKNSVFTRMIVAYQINIALLFAIAIDCINVPLLSNKRKVYVDHLILRRAFELRDQNHVSCMLVRVCTI